MNTFSASASATFFYMSDAIVAVDTTQRVENAGTTNLSASAPVRVVYRAPKNARRS